MTTLDGNDEVARRETIAPDGRGTEQTGGRKLVSAQRLLFASLVVVPGTLLADVLGASDVALFVLSVVALIPLAWVIGEATEQVGEYTGPTIAALLNASFGNAPEVIVALLAVHRGLFDVVRGSLAGSVIGNLLLVLGFSLLIGGRGHIGRRVIYPPLAMVALAGVLFVVPGLAGHAVAYQRLTVWGIAVAAFLLAVYSVVTVRSMLVERRRNHQPGGNGEPGGSGRPEWSLSRGVITLALATVATVAMSEVLTGSIEAFARSAGMSDLFVSAVIVAIAGNAAEHGGAIVIAARGSIRLASEIAFQSASQVAVGVIPVVVLLSLAIRPLPLFFHWTEYLGLAIAVAVPALFLLRGRSVRWHGLGLLIMYVVIATVFFSA